MRVLRPLEYKEIKFNQEWHKRVLFFNPRTLQLNIDHYQRTQSIPIASIFPKVEGYCSCGCGEKLTGRKTRWYSEDCHDFASSIWAILTGRTVTIKFFLKLYYGWECQDCGCKDTGHTVIRTSYNGSKYEDSISLIKIDHIVPVKHGGGGCWLSNYRLRCHSCHKDKTNKDFGWKSKLTSHEPQIR